MLNRSSGLRVRLLACRCGLLQAKGSGSWSWSAPASAALAAGLAGLALAGSSLGGTGLPARSAETPASTRAPRPPDLVILQRSESVNGVKQIGVFGAKADPRSPGMWSVQVWEETNDRVTIATDRISCSPTAPLRTTGSGSQLLVRELNPGGAIHPANRLDHLIWWAVCHPAFAGRDPAGLAAEARRLGYSGQLQESQQVLQAPRN